MSIDDTALIERARAEIAALIPDAYQVVSYEFAKSPCGRCSFMAELAKNRNGSWSWRVFKRQHEGAVGIAVGTADDEMRARAKLVAAIDDVTPGAGAGLPPSRHESWMDETEKQWRSLGN
jgi:hypothetical protein